jgi:hypothetical protein
VWEARLSRTGLSCIFLTTLADTAETSSSALDLTLCATGRVCKSVMSNYAQHSQRGSEKRDPWHLCAKEARP